MKKINDLYKDINSDIEIKGIKNDYQEIEDNDIFICTNNSIDGHDYIDEAIKRGAKIIIVSKDIPKKSVYTIKVPNTNIEYPYLCQKFYDYPDKTMKVIGITGNDGKTTTSFIIQNLIGSNECGYISNIERNCSFFSKKNEYKNLNCQRLYSYIKEFNNNGLKYIALEIQDKDILNNTYKAIQFDVLQVTNITNDITIYDSIEKNISKKIELIKQIKKDGICILNKDDKYFDILNKSCSCKVLTYGKGIDNDLQILDFITSLDNTIIKYKYNDKIIEVNTKLIGEFNVYNIASSLLTTIALGLRLDVIVPRINNLKLNGKLELLNTKTPYYIMIDNAHTPNSINKLLSFINTLDTNRVIVVIGKKGNEDIINRPVIGKLIAEKASYCLFTSDDPRDENELDIINNMIKEIKDTFSNYEIIIDRREAIKKAINLAEEKDLILILGRGNEEYIEKNNEKKYFNDIEESYNAVIKRNMKDR